MGTAPMSDDDETHLHVTYASHFDMDEAFSARMRAAIGAGLENALGFSAASFAAKAIFLRN